VPILLGGLSVLLWLLLGPIGAATVLELLLK
jgi:hypothetical protein